MPAIPGIVSGTCQAVLCHFFARMGKATALCLTLGEAGMRNYKALIQPLHSLVPDTLGSFG
jgi:hypothetical protein